MADEIRIHLLEKELQQLESSTESLRVKMTGKIPVEEAKQLLQEIQQLQRQIAFIQLMLQRLKDGMA
jgi:predicted  nucleic acid-binding Zn-ribbon protein